MLEEFDRAFRICMLESVRNDMIMTLKSLDMWHDDSNKPSEGIPDNDCSWEDVSAPLPVIAQRLYNDHVRRNSGASRMRCLKRRAETASFIVDFAHDTGIPLPEISETHKMMLDEFKACASSWERQQAADSRSPKAGLVCKHLPGHCQYVSILLLADHISDVQAFAVSLSAQFWIVQKRYDCNVYIKDSELPRVEISKKE